MVQQAADRASGLDDERGDDDGEDGGRADGGGPRDRRPSWPQIALLAIACLFAGAAGMYWWEQRGPNPNDADIGFYDDMTAHHLQAIDMAQTYLRHGEFSTLRAMANEVAFFQSGDVRMMQAGLQEWGEQPDDDVAMGWMGMEVPEQAQPGMATPDQLRQLRAARGRELDELYTRLMINHHAGGKHMADAEVELGRDGEAKDFAAALARTQATEIDELNWARERLGLEPVDPGADPSLDPPVRRPG
jgi:uncharacterized protein (DUF305 family)